MFEDFLPEFMGDEARGCVKIFETQTGEMLSDQSKPFVSLINLASIRDIGGVTGMELDPIRFRGNFYFESDAPWLENNWLDKTFNLGGATFKVVAPVSRCVSTHVNPVTSKHDVNILQSLTNPYCHNN